MTQPSHEALTSPAASILRRRWFWIAFVAVLAVLAAMAGGTAVGAFPIVERFIDIGTREELDKALLWFATGEEE